MDAPSDADALTWVTDQVAITNFASAHRADLLAGAKVAAVLCLDRGQSGGPAGERGVGCVRVAHLVDGANEPAVFANAVAALRELVALHGRVLVHCRAGRSRSVAVVAAYLAGELGIGADEALAFVTAKRASAVAPELVRLARRLSVQARPHDKPGGGGCGG